MPTSDASQTGSSSDDFETLFRSAPEPYFVTDHGGAIQDVNNATCAFLQSQRPALVGRPIASLATRESRRQITKLLTGLAPGDLVRETIEVKTGDEARTCRAAFLMVLNSGGNRQILCLLEDITQEVEAQAAARRINADLERKVGERTAELEATLERLQVAMRHKDEFLSMMSHELRTPLTVILGGARLLSTKLDAITPDDRTSLMKDMVREGERLQHLIENLMILARVNAVEQIELEPLMLQRLIPAAVAGFAAKTNSRPVNVNVPQDLPPVLGSQTHVEQVVTNLLANSLKYASSDACIDVSARRIRRYVVISVRDYGRGLAADDARHIFEPFYRSKTVQVRTPGAGIGLTVCRQLMEAQGGRIWTRQPANGTGTVFSFALGCAEGSPEEA